MCGLHRDSPFEKHKLVALFRTSICRRLIHQARLNGRRQRVALGFHVAIGAFCLIDEDPVPFRTHLTEIACGLEAPRGRKRTIVVGQ